MLVAQISMTLFTNIMLLIRAFLILRILSFFSLSELHDDTFDC